MFLDILSCLNIEALVYILRVPLILFQQPCQRVNLTMKFDPKARKHVLFKEIKLK